MFAPAKDRPQLTGQEFTETLIRGGYTSSRDLRCMTPDQAQWTVAKLRGWIQEMATADQLIDWLKNPRGSMSVIYFKGNLASFREDCHKRIVKLQKLQDSARPSRPRPPKEAFELSEMQRRQEICRAAQSLAEKHLIHVAQRRNPDNPVEWIYTATRRNHP